MYLVNNLQRLTVHVQLYTCSVHFWICLLSKLENLIMIYNLMDTDVCRSFGIFLEQIFNRQDGVLTLQTERMIKFNFSCCGAIFFFLRTVVDDG